MFATWDAITVGHNQTQRKASSDRACDQCKSKKVRCDMSRPCNPCSTKGFACSYDRPRKKRGPTSERMLQMHQQTRSQSTIQQSTIQQSTIQHPTIQQCALLPSDGPSITVLAPSETLPFDGDAHKHPAQQSNESSNHHMMTSPNAFIFPSLPAEFPSGSVDHQFGSILEQDPPRLADAEDVWPPGVNETTLLPWIDVYFKRLHPTIPILNRTNIYSDMLLRKHRTDPHYGAMLLGLTAFAMTQPVQIHERSSMPSRSVQARMLLEECVRMRVTADFGESPTIEMTITSFFLFACLFGNNQHKAARHRLREAVDLAYSLGLHLPDSYIGLATETREQWLRTYLLLSVTERAYALQQNHAISFRGQPGMTARFMHAFDPTVTSEYISTLIYQDHDRSDSVGMTGLLYLMDTFDAIDENVMDCWNGFCRFSDGVCENFDRRRALHMFKAQRRIREACVSGNISFAPSATPLPLSRLLETQQADIAITQFWLLNRLWNLCWSHQLLLERSDHCELRFDFACRIAHAVLSYCNNNLTLASMEAHGVGFIEKVCDVAMGITVAMRSSHILLETTISHLDSEQHNGIQITVRALLEGLGNLIGSFRGGDHPYNSRFQSAIEAFPQG